MSQSINFANVTEATFNGSAVEQINLNGAGVWTKPANDPPLQIRRDIGDGLTNLDTYTANPGGWFNIPNGVILRTSRGVTLMGINGKAYVGYVGQQDVQDKIMAYIGPQTIYPVIGAVSSYDNQTTAYYLNAYNELFMPLAEITSSGMVKVPSMPSNQQTEVTVLEGQYGPLKDIVRIYCDSTWAIIYVGFTDINWSHWTKYGGLKNVGGSLLQFANSTPWATTTGHYGTSSCSAYFPHWGHNPENVPSKYAGVSCSYSYFRITI